MDGWMRKKRRQWEKKDASGSNVDEDEIVEERVAMKLKHVNK